MTFRYRFIFLVIIFTFQVEAKSKKGRKPASIYKTCGKVVNWNLYPKGGLALHPDRPEMEAVKNHYITFEILPEGKRRGQFRQKHFSGAEKDLFMNVFFYAHFHKSTICFVENESLDILSVSNVWSAE